MDLFNQLLTPPEQGNRVYGMVVALVTNTQDPDNLGRVKVKFPWLSDQVESDWARVAMPMAGADRGIYFLPEVDDEVLVGFEHGLVEYPYILGALWNGKDKPPEPNDDGKNNLRTIKSRSGHIIRLDDTEDAEKIEIVAKGAKSTITIDAKENTIAIQSDKDLTIESGSGALKLSGKSVEISSTADAVKVTSKTAVEISASGDLKQSGTGVEIQAKGDLKQSGTGVEIQAKGKMDLQAGPQLNIKGGMININ